jgi:hypothetical protein
MAAWVIDDFIRTITLPLDQVFSRHDQTNVPGFVGFEGDIYDHPCPVKLEVTPLH